MKSSYESIDCLKNIYLEDSYVLGIHETGDSFAFDLEAVLTEDHPDYSAPKPSEQYCYRKIKLIFQGVQLSTWYERTSTRTTDIDSSVDFGNIDEFTYDENMYSLKGDWGSVDIAADSVKVEY